MESNKNIKKFNDLMDLGKFYFINEKYDQALKEFIEAEKINNKCADLYLNMGLVYEARNDLVNAKLMYEKVLQLDINNKKANERIEKIIDR